MAHVTLLIKLSVNSTKFTVIIFLVVFLVLVNIPVNFLLTIKPSFPTPAATEFYENHFLRSNTKVVISADGILIGGIRAHAF